MNARRLCGALVLALACCWAGTACAHINNTGLATLTREGDGVIYRLTLVPGDLPEPTAALIQRAADGDRASAESLAGAARRSVTLTIGGRECRPGRFQIQGSQLAEGRVVLRLDFDCPQSSGPATLREDWRELFGDHYRTLMAVKGGNEGAPLVLDEDNRAAAFSFETPALTRWSDFILLGVNHILTGYDHLLFLLALLVGAARLWSVVKIVTAFTLAHSVSLSAAVLGWVNVPGSAIEPLIAASIVWVALENLVLRGQLARRWAIAFAFGLIHGLGFAGALVELELPAAALVRALVGFNIGVELGQLACVVAVLPPLAWLMRRSGWGWLAPGLSAIVAAFGLYWLVERLFFP